MTYPQIIIIVIIIIVQRQMLTRFFLYSIFNKIDDKFERFSLSSKFTCCMNSDKTSYSQILSRRLQSDTLEDSATLLWPQHKKH